MSQRFDVGMHHVLHGEYDRAVRAFQEVVHDDPMNGRAWAFLGISHAHLGHGLEAESALSRAIRIDPQNSEAWFHLGVARGLRTEWPEAASAYRRAVALAPDDMVAWHRLGVALAESGDEIGASAAFERALVLSRETGEKPLEEPVPADGADTHLTEVAEIEAGREAKSWLDLALSLLSLGEEEEAVAAYERAYTLDPERASLSLFRPMLRLMTAATGQAIGEEPAGAFGPQPPTRRDRPQGPQPTERDRPEVA